MRLGVYLETAAALCGLEAGTVNDWLRRGERERQRLENCRDSTKPRASEEPYLEFSAMASKTLATLEGYLVKKVIDKQPLEILKRRFRNHWGNTGVGAEGDEPTSLIPEMDFNPEVDDFTSDDDAQLTQLLIEQLGL